MRTKGISPQYTKQTNRLLVLRLQKGVKAAPHVAAVPAVPQAADVSA